LYNRWLLGYGNAPLWEGAAHDLGQVGLFWHDKGIMQAHGGGRLHLLDGLKFFLAAQDPPADLYILVAHVGMPVAQEVVDDTYLLDLRLSLKRRIDLSSHVLGLECHGGSPDAATFVLNQLSCTREGPSTMTVICRTGDPRRLPGPVTGNIIVVHP